MSGLGGFGDGVDARRGETWAIAMSVVVVTKFDDEVGAKRCDVRGTATRTVSGSMAMTGRGGETGPWRLLTGLKRGLSINWGATVRNCSATAGVGS